MKSLNYKQTAIIILALVLIVGLAFFLSYGSTNRTNNRDQANITTYEGIKPGSILGNIQKDLGEPIEVSKEDGTEVYKYPSGFESFPDEIHTGVSEETNKVLFIKEYVRYNEGRNITEYYSRIGEPDITLYRDDLGPAYSVAVYLEQGVAVSYHNHEGSITEIWYFEPTNLETFRESWGQELTDEPHNEPEAIH